MRNFGATPIQSDADGGKDEVVLQETSKKPSMK